MSIRVVLVDVPEARKQVRSAVRFRGMLTVVGEASTAAGAVELAQELTPDIVVLDVALADLAGEDVLGRIRSVAPATKVIVYSGSERPTAPCRIGQADGYAIKGGQLDYLVELLETLGQQGAATARLGLAFSFASPREAREFTRETLRRWELPGLVDDALVLVSEMVNNAVLHAQSACELCLSISPVALRIEVVDSGGGAPDPVPSSRTRTHGRGLHLIGAIAAAWGVQPTPEGKIVWAELLREPAGDAEPPELG
jgi:DNA-binding NarL/FixJ family response regulator